MPNTPRESFREMLNICYEEDFQELHKELIALEFTTKKSKEEYKYEDAMQEILTLATLFAEDFPTEVFDELQNILDDYLENKE